MERQDVIKPGYYGYPQTREAPHKAYVHIPGSNPVLKGLPLAIAGSAAANIGFISSMLWGNVGFRALRKVKLDDYESRYDPTVIPIDAESNPDAVGAEEVLNRSYRVGSKSVNRHHSVADYHSAYEGGKLTPTIVAETLLDLISNSSKHKEAFLEIRRDRVIAAAEASTQRYKDGKARGLFDGVPVAVKDEVDLHGYTKCLGSCRDFTSPVEVTSWCVRKWEDSGAVILGKLSMHELGMDTTNNNPIKGTPLNPHNPHYYTGGSSGGSAYAVAAGLCPVTLGADGGGSIRIPSANCGLYGLKTSHGRVSASPTPSFAPSCGVVGPMASNMADLEYAYRLMAIPDPSDSVSSTFPLPVPKPAGQNKVMGIYKPYFDVADPAVLNACHDAIAHYQSSGYKVIDIKLPYLAEGQLAHAMTILSELSTSFPDLTGLSPATKINLAVGKQTSASDFLLAQKMRSLLMQHLAFLFKQDPGLLIITPTTPDAGWHISGGTADLKHGISDANMSLRNMTFVWLANFSGCPSITIPVGRAEPKEGEGKLPIGMMAMGEWGAENELIEWGKIGEEYAWEDGEAKMSKPDNWVDVLALANAR